MRLSVCRLATHKLEDLAIRGAYFSFVNSLKRFDYFGWNVDADIKIQYVLDMFYELFDETMSRSTTPISSSNAVAPVGANGDAAAAAASSRPGTSEGNSRWFVANGSGATRLQMDREAMLHFLLTVRWYDQLIVGTGFRSILGSFFWLR